MRFLLLILFSFPFINCSNKSKVLVTSGYQPTASAKRTPLTLETDVNKGSILEVTTQSPYDSWRGLIYKNPNIETFLIHPGDYRKWGMLRPSISGTSQKHKNFIYYSSKEKGLKHPANFRKNGGEEVIVEGFNFNNISFWNIRGITFRGNGAQREGKVGGMANQIVNNSDHISISNCVVEEVLLGNAINIKTSNYTLIDNCVIRNKIEGFSGDNIGITISAEVKKESRGTKVVNSEIYNYTDGVQLVYYTTPSRNALVTGEVPETTIENNDIYITKALHTLTPEGEKCCAENAIDIKVGTSSDEPTDRIRVTNNRMWGYRLSDSNCAGSGLGDAITIHRNAQHIVIDNNTIFDCAKGISVGGKNKSFPEETVSNIVIFNNIIYNLWNTSKEQPSVAILTASDVDIYKNTFLNVNKVFGSNSNSDFIEFNCNTLINIDTDSDYQFINSGSRNYNAWINYAKKNKSKWNAKGESYYEASQVDRSIFDSYSYSIKNITSPEELKVPNVIPKKGFIRGSKGKECQSDDFQEKWWGKALELN